VSLRVHVHPCHLLHVNAIKLKDYFPQCSVFFIRQYEITTTHTNSEGTHLESQQPGRRYTNWSYLWFSSVQYIFLMNVRIGIGKSKKQLAMSSMIGVYIPTEAGLFVMLQHPHQLSELPTLLLNGNLRTLV